MKRFALLLALTLPALPLAAEDTALAGASLNLEQAMLLRCSAAFAIIASEQQRGVASAQAWPPLDQRGREFFVRASARLMDDLGLSRDQIQAMMQSEVERLSQAAAEAEDPAAYVEGVMQPCLLALDSAGL